MLNYKSMSDDELRRLLASAGAEMLSRRSASVSYTSRQHMYRITMRRTSQREPQAFRFTLVEGAVVRLPLPLDQIVGKTGKVIGGEFLLDDGDVVQKIFSSGMDRYYIAWQGSLDHPDYDAYQVLQGETESETIAKVEQFVCGDRTLVIEDLSHTISSMREGVAEYEEKGRTDAYWKRVAERDRHGIGTLETCCAGRNRHAGQVVGRTWSLRCPKRGDHQNCESR